MTDEQEHWARLARYLAGESSPREVAAVERWLAADLGRRRLLEELRAPIERLRFQPQADLDVEAALARVHARMAGDGAASGEPELARRPRARLLWQTAPLRAAAAVLAAVTVLYAAYLLVRPDGGVAPPVASRSYETPVGRTQAVRLADGTAVVLGPRSRLVVAAGYGAERREVRLDGVAWFHVVHDAAREFQVHTADAVITDLGTAFTVDAAETGGVRVAVTEGAVRLAPNAPAAGDVILTAGQQGTVGDGAAAVTPVDTAAAVAWVRGRLLFRDAPLARVAAELERWYGVTLLAADSAVAARRLTAQFEGEPVEAVLDVIASALGARLEQRGDTIVLRAP